MRKQDVIRGWEAWEHLDASSWNAHSWNLVHQREVWPPSWRRVETGVPGTSAGPTAAAEVQTHGGGGLCSPQPSRHHMQNHPAWHNQEKQERWLQKRNSSSHPYQQGMRNHLVKERLCTEVRLIVLISKIKQRQCMVNKNIEGTYSLSFFNNRSLFHLCWNTKALK